MRILFPILLASSLCACHSSSTTNTTDAPVAEQLQDVTDRSSCQGAPGLNPSIFSNAWHMQMANSQFHIDMAFQFNQNNLTLTNTCFSPDGQSVAVSVTAAIQINGNQILIPQAAQNQNEVDTGSAQDTCSASIAAGSITYGFTGNCLSLDAQGQIKDLVP